jgi:hypothetical protein
VFAYIDGQVPALVYSVPKQGARVWGIGGADFIPEYEKPILSRRNNDY